MTRSNPMTHARADRDASKPVAAARTVDRRGGWLRWVIVIVATLAMGLLAAVAIGFGLPRIGLGGWGVAIAVIALAVAGALLVAGATILVRSTRGWRRTVIIPWGVVVAVMIYSVAIAVAAVYPPRSASAMSVPEGAEHVEMTTPDGVRLSGWYWPSRNGAAVVLRHGAGSSSADTLEHARVLHDAGYGVLATDARGHGNSGGRGMEFGWYGEQEIRAAVDLLTEREDVDPDRIGVVGLSMGGEEAIGAAGEDARIRAVVAEGATGRTAADKAWLAEEYGPAGVIQGFLDALTYGVVDLLSPPSPPDTLAAAIRDCEPTAVLLIAGGEEHDEQSVAARLQAVAPERVEVWTAPGARHVDALGVEPAQWRARVIGFLDVALGSPS